MKRARAYLPISIITAFALLLRLWRLNQPKGYVFDEVYYAKNANSLIKHGVELSSTNQAEFIVHPPLGKWLIGIGIKLFGNNEFGWRISAAVIGSASVLIIYLLALKLFNSIFLASIASSLLALDGLNLVMSRVALLDIFLMLFILLATYFLLINQYWLSAVAIGAATGVKWSGAYLIPVFLIISINFVRNGFLKQIAIRITQFIVTPVLVYLMTWTGWVLSKDGWDRNRADGQSKSFIPNVVRNLWHYHVEILNFHTGLHDKHTYSANPWSWLILGRPTSFYYQSSESCKPSSCAQEILAIGTPLLWWAATISLAVTTGLWLKKRDQASSLILAGVLVTYLPWFFFQNRTMFYFYAVTISPFLILSLVYVISKALQSGVRREFVYLFIFIIFINFIYFLPVFIGIEIPYSSWLSRMWLPSWI
jgi:dolichyl-phosphate-mannose-protein mannosyltransferase